MQMMRLHQVHGTIIGGINCIFLKKSWYVYKCSHPIKGYAIDRKRWQEIEEIDQFKATEVKRKMLQQYLREIHYPLIK